MERALTGVESVSLFLEKRIERCSARIIAARKAAAERRRGAAQVRASVEVEMAMRRAYRDALRAIAETTIGAKPSATVAAVAAVRLAAEELERVKKALAVIYEVSRHSNHDFSEAGDWGTVEGEAQTALNVLRDAERPRS
jgi:hypothetical protein